MLRIISSKLLSKSLFSIDKKPGSINNSNNSKVLNKDHVDRIDEHSVRQPNQKPFLAKTTPTNTNTNSNNTIQNPLKLFEKEGYSFEKIMATTSSSYKLEIPKNSKYYIAVFETIVNESLRNPEGIEEHSHLFEEVYGQIKNHTKYMDAQEIIKALELIHIKPRQLHIAESNVILENLEHRIKILISLNIENRQSPEETITLSDARKLLSRLVKVKSFLHSLELVLRFSDHQINKINKEIEEYHVDGNDVNDNNLSLNPNNNTSNHHHSSSSSSSSLQELQEKITELKEEKYQCYELIAEFLEDFTNTLALYNVIKYLEENNKNLEHRCGVLELVIKIEYHKNVPLSRQDGWFIEYVYSYMQKFINHEITELNKICRCFASFVTFTWNVAPIYKKKFLIALQECYEITKHSINQQITQNLTVDENKKSMLGKVIEVIPNFLELIHHESTLSLKTEESSFMLSEIGNVEANNTKNYNKSKTFISKTSITETALLHKKSETKPNILENCLNIEFIKELIKEIKNITNKLLTIEELELFPKSGGDGYKSSAPIKEQVEIAFSKLTHNTNINNNNKPIYSYLVKLVENITYLLKVFKHINIAVVDLQYLVGITRLLVIISVVCTKNKQSLIKYVRLLEATAVFIKQAEAELAELKLKQEQGDESLKKGNHEPQSSEQQLSAAELTHLSEHINETSEYFKIYLKSFDEEESETFKQLKNFELMRLCFLLKAMDLQPKILQIHVNNLKKAKNIYIENMIRTVIRNYNREEIFLTLQTVAKKRLEVKNENKKSSNSSHFMNDKELLRLMFMSSRIEEISDYWLEHEQFRILSFLASNEAIVTEILKLILIDNSEINRNSIKLISDMTFISKVNEIMLPVKKSLVENVNVNLNDNNINSNLTSKQKMINQGYGSLFKHYSIDSLFFDKFSSEKGINIPFVGHFSHVDFVKILTLLNYITEEPTFYKYESAANNRNHIFMFGTKLLEMINDNGIRISTSSTTTTNTTESSHYLLGKNFNENNIIFEAAMNTLTNYLPRKKFIENEYVKHYAYFFKFLVTTDNLNELIKYDNVLSVIISRIIYYCKIVIKNNNKEIVRESNVDNDGLENKINNQASKKLNFFIEINDPILLLQMLTEFKYFLNDIVNGKLSEENNPKTISMIKMRERIERSELSQSTKSTESTESNTITTTTLNIILDKTINILLDKIKNLGIKEEEEENIIETNNNKTSSSTPTPTPTSEYLNEELIRKMILENNINTLEEYSDCHVLSLLSISVFVFGKIHNINKNMELVMERIINIDCQRVEIGFGNLKNVSSTSTTTTSFERYPLEMFKIIVSNLSIYLRNREISSKNGEVPTPTSNPTSTLNPTKIREWAVKQLLSYLTNMKNYHEIKFILNQLHCMNCDVLELLEKTKEGRSINILNGNTFISIGKTYVDIDLLNMFFEQNIIEYLFEMGLTMKTSTPTPTPSTIPSINNLLKYINLIIMNIKKYRIVGNYSVYFKENGEKALCMMMSLIMMIENRLSTISTTFSTETINEKAFITELLLDTRNCSKKIYEFIKEFKRLREKVLKYELSKQNKEIKLSQETNNDDFINLIDIIMIFKEQENKATPISTAKHKLNMKLINDKITQRQEQLVVASSDLQCFVKEGIIRKEFYNFANIGNAAVEGINLFTLANEGTTVGSGVGKSATKSASTIYYFTETNPENDRLNHNPSHFYNYETKQISPRLNGSEQFVVDYIEKLFKNKRKIVLVYVNLSKEDLTKIFSQQEQQQHK